MTPEPDQSSGTHPRNEEACPEVTKDAASVAANPLAHPLSDFVPESWKLPDQTELTARRVDLHAARAALRATSRDLEARGDWAGASAAHARYARACWAKGFAYGEANQAARRAIELAPGDPIRSELADNLEKIGAHLECAQILELDGAGFSPAMRHRVACLYCRAGDAAGAAMHFAELARITPESTDALTRIGTLAGWAPEQVSRERGIVAWHEASRRHQSSGDLLGAFEACHRAFELDPASSLTAERLARELDTLGRKEAADEVWRQSAVAAGDSARHDVRALAALEAGDIVRALAALLDGRADVSYDTSQLLAGVEQLLSPRSGISRGFDTVLAELGCADWLAVRLEAGPLLERWTDEANCHVALGRLETSYFTQLDAAREAFVRAIIAQPAQSEARARLSNWAPEWQNPDPLLRALVQCARTAQGGLVARQLAGELIEREPATEELA
ncbi:MAG TPA: hypothetical protein VKP30_20910, partial [Polyangiaceae bacterium]|nr:hypothetical protein [Polyangiaceae bacterium]